MIAFSLIKKGRKPMTAMVNEVPEQSLVSFADRFAKVEPLNFDAKADSLDALNAALNPVRPAEEACGLCKILLASG